MAHTNNEVRERIASAVAREGANPVARRLGVSRPSLVSWLAGAAREATAALILSRANRLDAPAALDGAA